MINITALTISLIASGTFLIVKKIIKNNNSFEKDVKNRFLQAINSMNKPPITTTNMTFGLYDIEQTDYGFRCRITIPIGLSESNFTSIIPILENAYKCDIEYKNYYMKCVKKKEEGILC